MRGSRVISACIAIAAFVENNSASAQSITISDSDFAPSSWVADYILRANPTGSTSKSGLEDTFYTTQRTANGVGGSAYRETIHNWSEVNNCPASGDCAWIQVSHIFAGPGANFSQSSQAISSIDSSYRIRAIAGSIAGADTRIGYTPAIRQDGNIYVRRSSTSPANPHWDIGSINPPSAVVSPATPDDLIPVPSGPDSVWTLHAATLTATDFVRISGDGPAEPRFGCNEPDVEFGYATANSFKNLSPDPALAARTTVSGIDDWSMTASFDECPPPAEPAILKICKAAGDGVAIGDSFTFNVDGRSIGVLAGPPPGGYCTVVTGLAAGQAVNVVELAGSGFGVRDIRVRPAQRLVGAPDLSARSTSVILGSGVTEVTFTNELRTGYIEICKRAEGGEYRFTVDGLDGVFAVPAQHCTPPILVPAGEVVIRELEAAGASMTNCEVAPAAANLVGFDAAARTCTVRIAPGAISAQTIVTITNEPVEVPGDVSDLVITKIIENAAGVPETPEQDFPMTLNCTGPGSAASAYNFELGNDHAGSMTKTVPGLAVGSVCTISETLSALDISFCRWESSFPQGQSVTITAGSNAITVRNRLVCDNGLVFVKDYEHPDSGPVFQTLPTAQFTVTAQCHDPANPGAAPLSISGVIEGHDSFFASVPAAWICDGFAEVAPAQTYPNGCHWIEGEFGAESVVVKAAPQVTLVTLTNKFACPYDLALTKTIHPNSNGIATDDGFTLKVSNVGTNILTANDADAIIVTDSIPAGFTLLSYSHGSGGPSTSPAWNCTPAAPFSGAATFTCSYVGGLGLGPSQSLPPIYFTRRHGPVVPKDRTNCATVSLDRDVLIDVNTANNTGCAP